jgi:hypothetical protein
MLRKYAYRTCKHSFKFVARSDELLQSLNNTMLMFQFVVKLVYKSTTPDYRTHTGQPHGYERIAARTF